MPLTRHLLSCDCVMISNCLLRLARAKTRAHLTVLKGRGAKLSKQDYRAPTRVILRGALGWARVLGVAGGKSNLKRLYIHTRRHYALSAPHFCMAHFPNPNSDLARPPRLLFLLTGTPGAKFRRPAGGRARETGPIFESRHTKTKKRTWRAWKSSFASSFV